MAPWTYKIVSVVIVATMGVTMTPVDSPGDVLGEIDQREQWTLEERRAYGHSVAPTMPTEPLLEAVEAQIPAEREAEELTSAEWEELVEWPEPSVDRVDLAAGGQVGVIEVVSSTNGSGEVEVEVLDPASENLPGEVLVFRLGPALADGLESAEQVEHLDEVPATEGDDGIGSAAPADSTDVADPVELGDVAGPVQVRVDYSGLVGVFGADWSSRVILVELGPCPGTEEEGEVAAGTAPECQGVVVASVNDPEAGVLTASLEGAGVFAVQSAPAGPNGSWTASPLAPASSWQVGGNTGDLVWSYPMRVPPAAGGLVPQVEAVYSSASADGRVASTNNQASWVGDGWELSAGFIERRYVPCGLDTGGGNHPGNSAELCWGGDNASMVFAGHSGELVPIAGTNRWRLRNDDGTRIEQEVGAPNGSAGGQYWRVTTTDGTQYYFGRSSRAAGSEDQGSAWTVPVFGNHVGDPCYDGQGFTDSRCDQVWRWNLDYVVDTSGNTISYFYAKETNYYASAAGRLAYTRGGHLTRIDYGQRAGTETTTLATARVSFQAMSRCTSDLANCQLTVPERRSAFRDVPVDLVCDGTGPCTVTAPSFFSTTRLQWVTTQVRSGTGYRDVDRWTFAQSYPDGGNGLGPVMWLSSITHAGIAAGTVTLPKVTFTGAQYPNRVHEQLDGRGPMLRHRLTVVKTETGATTTIVYSAPDCTPTDLPASESSNSRRCFPVTWHPYSGGWGGDVTEYFHKYVVAQVTTNPGAHGETMVTSYDYRDGAAWHFDDGPLTPQVQRTWNQWRGYGKVDVTLGTADSGRSTTSTRYFRGMHGDRLPGGGTRTVSLDGIADVDHLAGMVRSHTTYAAPGQVLQTVTTTPWVSPPTATSATGRQAKMVGAKVVETVTAGTGGSGGRTARVTTDYDSVYGTVNWVSDEGDTALAADNRCTVYTYARNTGANITATPWKTEVMAGSCPQAPTSGNLLSATRVAFDGQGMGIAPIKGLVTRVEEATGKPGEAVAYQQTAALSYDVHGRVISATDAMGRVSTTAYTPATGGPVTKVTATSPDPDGSGPLTAHTTTTDIDPAWGAPTKVTDPSGRVTVATYDGLGRLTAVWLPGRVKDTDTASMTFGYTVSTSGVNAVTTKMIDANGAQRTSVELLDGLGRTRQTQTDSLNRDDQGRVVTDTLYDARGLVQRVNHERGTTGRPSTTLLAEPATPEGRTTYTYDGAGRVTAEIFLQLGVEAWRTKTAYGWDRVMVTPPAGGTPTTTIVDARGQTVALWQHKGSTTAAPHQTSTYGYDRLGRLTSMSDPAGDSWSYTYDRRGRQTSQTDPARGTTTTAYNTAGEVTSTTDARGVTLVYVRDQLGRATELRRNTTGGTLLSSWAYDTVAKGQVTSSTTHDGASAYTTTVTGYDPAYRPLGHRVTIPAAEGALAGTYTTSYTYRPDGQIDSLTLPAGGGLPTETVATDYDDAGMPRSLIGAGLQGAYVADAWYSTRGLTLQYDLGAFYANIVTYDYEPGTDRLIRTLLWRDKIPGNELDLRYTYDPAGNVTSLIDRPTGSANDAQCFTYDHLRRLTRVFTPTNANCATTPSTAAMGGPAPAWITYAYDAVGNRTTETDYRATATRTKAYTYTSTGNRLTKVTSTSVPLSGGAPTSVSSTFAYDPAGNTTTRHLAGTNAQTLTWDPQGQLTTVTQTGTATATNVYTPDGQRLVRRQGGATTIYLPGGMELTRQSTGATVGTRHYTFNGTPIATRSAAGPDAIQTLIGDHHNTGMVAIPNARTENDIPRPITRQRLDPFGVARTGATWPVDRGFLNKPTDATGLTQIGARYYDPVRARFISTDPLLSLTDPQQWNGYTYANNNPLTYWDPTGLAPGNRMLGDWTGPFPTAAALRFRAVLKSLIGTPPERPRLANRNAEHSNPSSYDRGHGFDVNGESATVNGLQSWAAGAIDAIISLINGAIWLSGTGGPEYPTIGNPNDPELGYDYSYNIGYFLGPQILAGVRWGSVAPATVSGGRGALIDPGKLDYLLGNVASSAHNAARSAQNAQQLARVGVHDNAAGRALLAKHFDDVVASNKNIARTYTDEFGTFQVRDSLFAGPGGFLKFESTWQVTEAGLRLITAIPFGGG